ncbi:helix-turn-helix domain-containing protein [Streptacidiphilus sp. EB103A]|uniref:helix-turn-helix domain-containing protein n=1 Tax=Streptacidiphilus sp. EB103A TaxID=3156275 RepID=UPI003516CDBA
MTDTGIRQRRTPPPELGEIINRGRLRAGLRGAECARVAGLSRAYLLQLELGKRVPSAYTVERLAGVLALTDPEREQLMAAAVPDAGRSHPGAVARRAWRTASDSPEAC